MGKDRSFRRRGRGGATPYEVELTPEQRRRLFEEDDIFGIEFGKTYECLHCGEVINTGEFKAVMFPHRAEPLVTCPNWPSCDADFKDWTPTDETRRWIKENRCLAGLKCEDCEDFQGGACEGVPGTGDDKAEE